MTGMALKASAMGLLILALCVLVGCGSSDGDADVTTQTTTVDSAEKREFLARGDAICAQAQAEAADLRRRAEEVQSQSDTLGEAEVIDRAEGIWTAQIELIERFRADIAALSAPVGDEATVDEFLQSFEDGIALAKQIESTLAEGEFPPEELVREYGNIVIRGNTLASAYGFSVCGRSG